MLSHKRKSSARDAAFRDQLVVLLIGELVRYVAMACEGGDQARDVVDLQQDELQIGSVVESMSSGMRGSPFGPPDRVSAVCIRPPHRLQLR